VVTLGLDDVRTAIGGAAMTGTRAVRNRFWVETALGSVAGILAVVTVFSREWIEMLFGVDPDGVAAFAVALGLVAHSELRRATA
jgi:hypothetical protein